ncbi:MAG: hypothetical protein AAFV43_07060 [Planctomycetota bacterium]
MRSTRPANRSASALYAAVFCLGTGLACAQTGEALLATDNAATPDMVEVFECLFDESVDINYDGWPDRWTRRRDENHPAYARMQIADLRPSDDGVNGRRMVMEPDGASAQVSSPPIFIMPKFSYVLDLRIRVDNAPHGSVRVRMVFAESDGTPRQVKESPPIAARGRWIDVQLGAVQSTDPDVDRCFVEVEYQRGSRGDLGAAVSIAEVRLARQPSIEIHTASPYNVYTDPRDVKVTCSVSGILERNPEIHFQLLDATNRTIGETGELELDGKLISATATRAYDIVDGVNNSGEGYEGAIDWRPPITDYGFYRIRVRMVGSETQRVIKELSTTVAVVREDLDSTERSEFGWSLPTADKPLPFRMLQELLPRVGIQYVKLPVWYPVDDDERGDEIIRFAEKLAARGIDTVGILEDPSLRIENPLSEEPPPVIQGLLTDDADRWRGLIDHVITKLSLRIRWWQLGSDRDTSFVGFPNLLTKVHDIHSQLFRFGQDVHLGLGWRWDHTQSWPRTPIWEFEQMAARESIDAAGLARAFEEAKPPQAERWVLVEPPQTSPGISDDHAVEVRRHQHRVLDFVEQIIIAKVNRADAVFVVDPFAGSADATLGRSGVMNDDGSPGELLLPWRTCARLLGGAEHIGSLRLPGGSRNWLFKRADQQVVMVLWSDEPRKEVLYLGEDLRVIDVWGKERPPELEDHRQVIPVDRMPRFVMGLSEPLARWRMDAELINDRVPSVFGIAHKNRLAFRNTFPAGVGGSMKIVPLPTGGFGRSNAVRFATPDPRFRLAAGARHELPFDATLVDAEYGSQPLRIDFELIQEEDPLRFSVWRDLTVGLGDLELRVVLEYAEDGKFVVKQNMRSHSGPPSDFKCLLYAAPLRRKRTQVFQLGPQLDTKKYTFFQGDSLAGMEMKLKVEEISGQRVLIKRFAVPPRPAPGAVESAAAEAPPANGFSKPPAPLAAAGG